MSKYESIKRYVEIKERDCETMPIRPSQALLNQRHLIDIIEKQRVHFGRIIGYTENLFDNVPAWRANQIAKEARKLTEE